MRRALSRRLSTRAVALVAEVLADDARDLVGVREQVVDRAVLLDPLDGRLLADLVDADQVVAGLPDQCRDLGILRRLDAVALAHRVGVVGLQFGHPAYVRVEHRHVVGDQLQGVAVAGGDQHPEAVRRAPRWPASRGCRRPRSPLS